MLRQERKKLSRKEKVAFKAGSHERRKRKRKRKRKEVHTSNANASTVPYASAIEYSKMVDEVDVLVLLFFLLLGLRRIRRRRLIQRNNKPRPKRLWVREIFRKRQLQGDYHNLVRELQLGDREYYFRLVIKLHVN